MEQHSVARLIGSPPGYVGHEEGGQLTEAVRRRPYSVVLFDEVEKAHPQVLNILLQVLDDGRLTDGKGRVVDFTNTVIFLTSNTGSRHLLTQKVTDQVRAEVMKEVRDHFRPEFLNRLDDIVIFQQLTMDQLREVARLLLNDLAAPLKRDDDIVLTLSDEALDLVVKEAYEPSYGARPIRRYLQHHIATQVARYIIDASLSQGSTVSVGVNEGSLAYIITKTKNIQDHDTNMPSIVDL